MHPSTAGPTRRYVVFVTLILAFGLVSGAAATPSAGRPRAHTLGSRPIVEPLLRPARDREPAVASSHRHRFVQRVGSRLEISGRPWRFAGVNMYWLGLDENVADSDGPTYPSHSAVDNGMQAAVDLGATVVRSTTLGVSVGSPRSIEPRLGQFNPRAFASIDYAVAAARRFGLRLMIPLTDEWHYYHGGKHTFTDWAGFRDLPDQTVVTSNEQREREAAFYTDPAVIRAFHQYVHHLLRHRNPLTGLRLGDDPTVAIWETGNELWDAPPDWTERTAAFIKTQAPHALVADGSAASGKQITETALSAPDVDVIDGHFYPTDTTKALHDADVTADHGKAYVIGEYPLNGTDSAEWLTSVADDRNICGDLAWSLFPWLADGTAERHDDGYTIHYPAANATEKAEDDVLRVHLRRMRRG